MYQAAFALPLKCKVPSQYSVCYTSLMKKGITTSCTTTFQIMIFFFNL